MKTRFLDIGVVCDRGDKRMENEDSILVKTSYVKGQEIGVFVVADGMGGRKDGQNTSRFVVNVIDFWWEYHFMEMIVSGAPLSEILKNLDEAILLANMQLLRSVEKTGTTLSLLLIIGDVYIVRHIGDSRIYRINKKIEQITEDHSYVEQLYKFGKIKRDDPIFYAKRNLLTQCMGAKPKINLFSKVERMQDEDVFLLCSDGFYTMTPDPDVLKVIFNKRIYSMQEKAKALRGLIKEGDAYDNVSILLVQPLKKQ